MGVGFHFSAISLRLRECWLSANEVLFLFVPFSRRKHSEDNDLDIIFHVARHVDFQHDHNDAKVELSYTIILI